MGALAGGNSEEFENGGGFEDGGGIEFHSGLPLFQNHPLPILAGEQALIVKAVDLAFEFANRPSGSRGFIFVKLAGGGSLDAHDQAVVRP